MLGEAKKLYKNKIKKYHKIPKNARGSIKKLYKILYNSHLLQQNIKSNRMRSIMKKKRNRFLLMQLKKVSRQKKTRQSYTNKTKHTIILLWKKTMLAICAVSTWSWSFFWILKCNHQKKLSIRKTRSATSKLARA